MEIVLKVSREKIKKTISNNDFFWYDNKAKKLIKLQGGTLEYKYDPKEKRMVPSTRDVDIYVNGNNFNHIENWVKQNQSEFEFYVIETRKGYSITISVDENKYSDIERSLYINRIIHD